MAVVSTAQNVFLFPRNDMPSVAIATSVFPTKAALKQLTGGIQVKEIQNYSGSKAIGSHGRKTLLMWRAAVEGLLERAALLYTRDSDDFHTGQLMPGDTHYADFSYCYVSLDDVLKTSNSRNGILGDEDKRRWRFDKLFNAFLHGVYYGLHKRNDGNFVGRSVIEGGVSPSNDTPWIIFPPILTTTEKAQDLFTVDITNADSLVNVAAAQNLFGAALQNFPSGANFSGGDSSYDPILSSSGIGHRWVTPICGYDRLDGAYGSVTAFLQAARGLLDQFVYTSPYDVRFRRRIGERLACCLNLLDVSRIGCWLARSCYRSGGKDVPRQSFVHKSVNRTVSISAGWSGEDDFSISIGNDPASETTADVGRYAKYGYEEGEVDDDDNGFESRWLYSAASTIGGAINDYFYYPAEYAWVAEYFSLVETRTIPGHSSEGTFVWISGSRLASLIDRLSDWQHDERIETNGSLHVSKTFSGTWTYGSSGNAYLGDIDYPCRFAVDNGYIKDAKEWLYGIGYCELNFDGSGYETIYDALRATGGTVKTNRQAAAAEIVTKYLADIWRGFGKISSRKMHASLAAMKSWMDAFGFAPDSTSPFYTSASLRAALIAARNAAQWQFEPYYCFVGVNNDGHQFYDWAGLWAADRAGVPDNLMRKIDPEDGDTWWLYEIARKSFTAPVWCRDYVSTFRPYQTYTAQGEIESFIGAFDWKFKAITNG